MAERFQGEEAYAAVLGREKPGDPTGNLILGEEWNPTTAP